MPPEEPGCFQVVFPETFRPFLEGWLSGRGLHLASLPIEDDIPTYIVGVTNI